MTVNPARHGPFTGRLEPDTISTYAAATGDDTAPVLAGQAVPAVFPVFLVFTAVQTARADVLLEAWRRGRGGVHRRLGLLGVDDPGRVSRVAVRFASPTPLGCDLMVNAYGIDERSFAFEAAADGIATITHGRLELRT